MTELTFVVLNGKGRASARSRELQDASARSHAAKFAHRRSKLQKLAHRPSPDGYTTVTELKSKLIKLENDDPNEGPYEAVIAEVAQRIPLHGDWRDPFNATPGADLPSYIHDALHFRMSRGRSSLVVVDLPSG
jgi:hypothetical protein